MTQTTAVQVAQQTPLTSIAAALAAASAIPAMSLVLERSVFPHVPWAWRTAIVAAFAVNLFAVSIPGRLDGQAQREGPRQWATLFAPAQWAFAIWGLIYIFETAFTVYAAFGAQGALAEALRQATPHWVTAHLMQVAELILHSTLTRTSACMCCSHSGACSSGPISRVACGCRRWLCQ
jgi:hypothetical protein